MNNKFSENLKKIRKDNNLSQEQLADELGVSRQAISKWESAVAYPEMDKIITLCEKFNLNIDDLLHKDIISLEINSLPIKEVILLVLHDKSEKDNSIINIIFFIVLFSLFLYLFFLVY